VRSTSYRNENLKAHVAVIEVIPRQLHIAVARMLGLHIDYASGGDSGSES
jgi:hypothetical protein